MRTGPVRGSITWIRQQRWHVERVEHEPSVTRLDVAGSGGRRTFFAPFDQPVMADGRGRPVHVRRARARAQLDGQRAQTFGINTIVAARNANLTLYAHQLEPVLAVLGGHRRVLIADAVGLGKTIQAGLVLAEALRHAPELRALLIVPAGLIDQWTRELTARFGLALRAADSIDHSQVTFGQHPWRVPGVWIGSADYLKQPHVFASLPTDPWGLVIVDEAHLSTGLSDRYRAVHALCQCARHVVLLTATPHSGDAAAFTRLIGLGALRATHDALLVFRRTRESVALGTLRRLRWHRVGIESATRTVLDELDRFENLVTHGAGTKARQRAALLVSVFRRRAASTLSAFSRTVARRLEWLTSAGAEEMPDWMQPSLFIEDDADLVGADERAVLTGDIGVPAGRERRALDRLYSCAVRALPSDVKLRRLSGLLARADEPAVVFTEFRHSLEAVVTAVARQRTVVSLHGGLSPAERRSSLDTFLSGRAAVLVATDVAGLGLNLQTRARWVVNLDIPWNPARLEQRIGRVDRMGQTRPVHATVLMLDHSSDGDVRRSLGGRADAARAAVDPSLFDTMATDSHEPAAAPLLIPTQRWVRSGRAQVRVLEASRALATHWRGPHAVRDRPLVVAPKRHGCPAGATHTWLGFLVPLVDRAGSSLEEHLVVARVPAALDPAHVPAAAMAQAEYLIARRLAARVRRVSRLLVARDHVRRAHDEAVSAHIETMTRVPETQLGLFVGTFRTKPRQDAADDIVAPRSTTTSADDGPRVSIGQPLLQWIRVT